MLRLLATKGEFICYFGISSSYKLALAILTDHKTCLTVQTTQRNSFVLCGLEIVLFRRFMLMIQIKSLCKDLKKL